MFMMTASERQPETKDLTTFLSQKGYDAIPIRENIAGLLLITVKVNDIEGLFILDTGAGVSVIDSTQASLLQLTLQKDNASFTGAGAGGQGLEVIPSQGNKIEIGNHTVMDFTLSVMSFDHVSQALTEAGCEEFSGVIGVDILKPGKAIIDYSSMTLYLSSEK
jgi:predicted aspartyl protease